MASLNSPFERAALTYNARLNEVTGLQAADIVVSDRIIHRRTRSSTVLSICPTPTICAVRVRASKVAQCGGCRISFLQPDREVQIV